MELSEQEVQGNKISDCVAELYSYCAILADYFDAHEEVEELFHASLIVDKMQEYINILHNIYFGKTE